MLPRQAPTPVPTRAVIAAGACPGLRSGVGIHCPASRPAPAAPPVRHCGESDPPPIGDPNSMSVIPADVIPAEVGIHCPASRPASAAPPGRHSGGGRNPLPSVTACSRGTPRTSFRRTSFRRRSESTAQRHGLLPRHPLDVIPAEVGIHCPASRLASAAPPGRHCGGEPAPGTDPGSESTAQRHGLLPRHPPDVIAASQTHHQSETRTVLSVIPAEGLSRTPIRGRNPLPSGPPCVERGAARPQPPAARPHPPSPPSG